MTSPVDRAAATLAGLLAAPDLDDPARLAVLNALVALDAVQPSPRPLPPTPQPVPAVHASRGLALALAQLREAVAQARDGSSALRAGMAAHYLLQAPPPPAGGNPLDGSP